MKLKVISKYANGNPCDLTLTKEKKVIKHGKIFEVDEARAEEILDVFFQGYPVAEVVEEEVKEQIEAEPKKKSTKAKTNNKK